MTSETTTKYAVVTGASAGIGFELARVLLREGFGVLAVAEDDQLDGAVAQLRDVGADVTAARHDLTRHEEVEALAARIARDGRPVDVLALNAGRGAGGTFVAHDGLRESSLAHELEIVDLNCRSTVHLAKLLLPAMVARGAGRVLVTSSIASTQPGAFQAVYNASKSFTQAFALGIREELKDTGVTVTSLMPGPTETEFFERGELMDTKVGSGPKDSPALVAEQAYEGLMAGDERVEAGGLKSKLQGRAGRFLPDSVKGKLHAGMAKPGSAED